MDKWTPISWGGTWMQQVVCLGTLCLTLSHALAGEKLKISTTPGKVELPQDLNKELPGNSDFFNSKVSGGESSQGPVLPMPNQPSLIRNPMLEEWLDKKKNWMMDTPNDVDRDKAIKAMFGVRESEFGSSDKKPKTVMERYWDSGKEKKDGMSPNRTSQRTDGRNQQGQRDFDAITGNYDATTGKYRSRDESQRRDSLGAIPALNPVYLFNSNLVPDGLNSPVDSFTGRSILPPNVNDPTFGQKPLTPAHDPNQAQRDFERIWDSRKMPLNRLNDPINAQSDATRFAINPISARRAGSLAAEPVQSQTSDTFAYSRSAPVAMRPDLLSPGQPMATGPSFAPAPALPAAPSIQAKPSVLEIPRPRF